MPDRPCSVRVAMLCLLLPLGCAHSPPPPRGPVGHASLQLERPQGQQLTVQLYYPVGARSPRRLPAVVLAHGYRQSVQDYRYLWRELVPRGYLVLVLDRLNDELSIDIGEFALDLNLVLQLLARPAHRGRPPVLARFNGQVALVGHSTGGGAIFLAADTARRVGAAMPQALVALAPLMRLRGPIYGRDPLDVAERIRIPTLVLDGAQDCICPPEQHGRELFARLPGLPSQRYRSLARGDHCGFGDAQGPRNLACRIYEQLACGLAQGETMSVAQQNRRTARLVGRWLERQLARGR